MEVIGDRHAPQDTDRRRQVGGAAQDPAARITWRVAVEMHHLACRMDPGVGASGADNVQRMACNERQCVLDRRLHGGFAAKVRGATLVEPLPA